MLTKLGRCFAERLRCCAGAGTTFERWPHVLWVAICCVEKHLKVCMTAQAHCQVSAALS